MVEKKHVRARSERGNCRLSTKNDMNGMEREVVETFQKMAVKGILYLILVLLTTLNGSCAWELVLRLTECCIRGQP